MNYDKLSKDKYRKLIDSLKIKDIMLKSVNIDDVEFPSEESLEVNLAYSCEEFNKIGEKMEFYPMFEVVIQEKKRTLVHINFKFLVSYLIECLDDYEDAYLILFKDKNVPINIWPYARELVSSLTSRIGYPSLTIDPYKSK